MTTYRIIIVNNHSKSGSIGSYGVFTQPPTVTGDSSSEDVYTNVWIAEKIQSGGNKTITSTSSFYAWVGEAPVSPAPGITVTGGVAKPVTLGTKSVPGSTWKMINNQGVPDLSGETTTANASSFEIDTGSDFTDSQNFLIGMGQLDNTGIVVPTAFIPADQNLRTNILPIVKFYVGVSSSVQGTIVDFQSSSAVAGVIDFSTGPGQGMYGAKVIHQPDGSFEVSYLSSVTFQEEQAALEVSSANLPPLDNDLVLVQREVEKLSDFIARLIDNQDQAPPDSVSVGPVKILFRAVVSWPAATSIAVITGGVTIISTQLINKNYQVTKTETSADGHTKTFTFGPNAPKGSQFVGDALSQAQIDWAAAVAADSKDHPSAGIVTQVSQTSLATKKQRARAYLNSQLNGLTV